MLTRLLIVLRLRRPLAPADPFVGEWVRVHTLAPAPSVEGVYLERRGGYVFVDTPTVLPDDGDDKKLGGKLAVPVERIVFVQVMPT